MVVKDSVIKLAPVEDVIDDFRAGKMVIIVDAPDRENEGDLAVATEKVNAENLSFMMKHARGLICTSISEDLAKQLSLPFQTLNNNSLFSTPFAVSIDHKEVVPHGVTAKSRSFTMQQMLRTAVSPADFVSPGNVMPLIANPAGVMGRQGQTEGSYDLARLAGLKASGVICEILNPNGTMARGTQLNDFASQHDLKITSVEDIFHYRVNKEVLVRNVASSFLNTDYGRFRVVVFQDDVDGKEHLALIYGDMASADFEAGPLLRIHSECLTGDVLDSRRCDCGQQLDICMQEIVKKGSGIVLYLRQEGRGIGLMNKLKAYDLQDNGFDTVEANIKLGFAPDERNFAVAAKILDSFGIKAVRALTNNPDKVNSLKRFGIEVLERVPVKVPYDEYSEAYLACKRDKMGHLI